MAFAAAKVSCETHGHMVSIGVFHTMFHHDSSATWAPKLLKALVWAEDHHFQHSRGVRPGRCLSMPQTGPKHAIFHQQNEGKHENHMGFGYFGDGD